ncbi:MAG: hypothetical protein ABSG78_04465 [Verrucomicrobiota bacterium]|jgi:hypothetical protein
MDTEPNPKEGVIATPPLPNNVGKTKPLTYIRGGTTTYTVLDQITRIDQGYEF